MKRSIHETDEGIPHPGSCSLILESQLFQFSLPRGGKRLRKSSSGQRCFRVLEAGFILLRGISGTRGLRPLQRVGE